MRVFCPEYVLFGIHCEKTECCSIPWNRLEPLQSGNHDLYRWSATTHHEFLQHGVHGHRAGGIRPWSSERAVRPQYPGRTGQHYDAAALVSQWTGGVTVPIGNHWEWDAGQRVWTADDQVGVGLTLGKGKREGFTKRITGNDLDYGSRPTESPSVVDTTSQWETRLIVTGESARDGDYAFNDLGSAAPESVPRRAGFRGLHQSRYPVKHAANRYEGSRFAFSTTTGLVRWKTQDVTDLDYTPRH